jgi:hypothetical protein
LIKDVNSFLKMSETSISDDEEFFSKEIINYQSGFCHNGKEEYSCYHPRMKVIYSDNTFKYFDMSALRMELLCQKYKYSFLIHVIK